MRHIRSSRVALCLAVGATARSQAQHPVAERGA